MILFGLILLGCEAGISTPSLGPCAELPSGRFDYGQVGIGTCLAGPVQMEWYSNPQAVGESWLVVANANPFLDYDGGSLLTLLPPPLEGGEEVLVSDLEAGAVDLPNFSGGLALVENRGLAVVPVKFSEGARTRETNDRVYLVNISDPRQPRFSLYGPDGAGSLVAESDPGPVVYDPESGRVYVVNTTSGSISVMDTTADVIDWIDAVPRARLDGVRLLDRDQSGSRVEVGLLDVIKAGNLTADTWALTFIDGTYRIRMATDTGVVRLESHGAENWVASALGPELTGEDGGWGEQLQDPQGWTSRTGAHRLAASDPEGAALVSATAAGSLSAWSPDDADLLSARVGEWDESVGGPMIVVDEGIEYLFYDGLDDQGVGRIGLAVSTGGAAFERPGGGSALWEPDVDQRLHDTQQAKDPYVVRDAQSGTWRMYYSAFDGERWSVGHAESADLLSWQVDPEAVFVPEDGEDCGSPLVSAENGRFRMWTVRGESGAWALGLATSQDGVSWADQGVVAHLDEVLDEALPGLGMQDFPAGNWAVSGEEVGTTGEVFSGSEGFVSESLGFAVTLVEGAILGPDTEVEASLNGVSASSWIEPEGLVYVDLVDANGRRSISVARWQDDRLSLEPGVLFEGEEGRFDEDGVFSPVVIADGSGYTMFYAGTRDGVTSVGRATSVDGYVWDSNHEPFFEGAEDWQSVAVTPGSVDLLEDGFELYFTGSNGEEQLIGKAVFDAAGSLVGDTHLAPVFDVGSPGTFDDSSVADPMVRVVDEESHLFYSGFDGSTWRVGHAVISESTGEWERGQDPLSGEARAVLEGVSGAFDAAGARRPVLEQDGSGTLRMLYTGETGGVERVGVSGSRSPHRFYRFPRNATVGDEILFKSHPGDKGGRTSIALSRAIASTQADGSASGLFNTSGEGVSDLLLDPAPGFLYASSVTSSYLYVIDVQDDDRPGPADVLHGREAVLTTATRPGGIGVRGMALSSDSTTLFAINDSPESVMIVDVEPVLDDAVGQVFRDSVVASLPVPRADLDEGVETLASIGGGKVVRSGDYLYVSNFNANSVGVYDLRLGTHGRLVEEVSLIGENPYAMSLRPDGKVLAIANYVGEAEGLATSSTIAFLDVDPTSDSFLEVQGWIVNK
ncbi:MAG: beta-propeller fold lactonase family protein [Myxococcota bacterium]|nr:beta-propeller fold lactonase family protein [Myxococcota bacterium]